MGVPETAHVSMVVVYPPKGYESSTTSLCLSRLYHMASCTSEKPNIDGITKLRKVEAHIEIGENHNARQHVGHGALEPVKQPLVELRGLERLTSADARDARKTKA